MNEDATPKAIESHAWPLCCQYVLVTFKAVPVQVWKEGVTCNRSVRWALGVLADGQYESLGVWPDEGTKADAWQATLEDMKVRGVERIRFIESDELVALQPILNAAYPRATSLSSPPQRGRAVVGRECAVRELQRRAGQSVRRHGCFVDMRGATAFIAHALMRAERRRYGITPKAGGSVKHVLDAEGQVRNRATTTVVASR